MDGGSEMTAAENWMAAAAGWSCVTGKPGLVVSRWWRFGSGESSVRFGSPEGDSL